MAERELAIIVRARDLASRTIGNVRKEIGTLGKAGGRAVKGLTTAMTRLATAAAVGLAGGIALGARSLGHLERVTNQTNAALESTGAIAGQTAESIRKHAEALEQLTTADDKAIQEGQNLLLTFTKIGGKTFPEATEAMVNMAIAMAKGDVAAADFKGTALQVGKALNDPIKGMTALSRAGVSFTQEQKDQVKVLVKSGRVQEAQALILRELTVEFGKAGKAAGTGFEADMRRVEDAGEDATQALARGFMPVLTRVAKFLSTKLADKKVLAALDELGKGLGDAAMQALDFVETVDFNAIASGLKTAKDAAAGIIGAFMSMPDWVKTAVVTGWGLNKLSGGALSGIVGALGSGLIKGILGMNAGVVNINAAVVNGGGGLPGAAAGIGAGTLLAGAAITAAAVAAVGLVAMDQNNKSTNFSAQIRTGLDASIAGKSLPEINRALAGVDQGIADITSNPLLALVQGEALTNLRAMKTSLEMASRNKSGSPDERQARAENARGLSAISLATHRAREQTARSGTTVASAVRGAGVTAKQGGLAAAAAIRGKKWQVNVRTNLTVNARLSARDTKSKLTFQQRAAQYG